MILFLDRLRAMLWIYFKTDEHDSPATEIRAQRLPGPGISKAALHFGVEHRMDLMDWMDGGDGRSGYGKGAP